MRLTSSQKQKIQTFYDYLCKMAGGEPVTAQKAAKAIQAYGGSLDYDYTLGMCERIQTGIEEMYRLCQDKESLKAPDFVQRMLDHMTVGMDPQQRKGFFLQCLDAFEQYPKSAPEMAARAALPEEALKNLLATRLNECAKPSVVQMADALTDPFFQEQSERAFDHTIGCKADAGSTLKNEAMAQKADAFFSRPRSTWRACTGYFRWNLEWFRSFLELVRPHRRLWPGMRGKARLMRRKAARR